MVNKTMTHLYGGLFLEKRKLLLPWGTSWQDLEHTGHPRVEMALDCRAITLIWENEEVLDGIEASVIAAYHPENRQRGLDFFLCMLRDPDIYGDPWEGLDPQYTHIVNMADHPKWKLHWGGYIWESMGMEIILYFWGVNEFHFTEDFRKGIIVKAKDVHLDRTLLPVPLPEN
jgi:hypothetical protein